MEQKIKVVATRHRFSHMGAHAGYDQVFSLMEKLEEVSVNAIWRIPEKFAWRFINLVTLIFFRIIYGNHFFTLIDWISNKRASEMVKKIDADIMHFSYLENNYGDPFHFFLDKRKVKLIGTIHQPVGWWGKKVRRIRSLSRFHALIVMSSAEERFFQESFRGKVYLIPHGIDTTYFCPDAGTVKDYKSCVFSGNWMRNIPLLINIINSITEKGLDIKFNIINPNVDNKKHLLYSLKGNKNVSLYKNLSDEELRDVYRKSGIMIMPLIDSTVNNALLEGAACGLPIVASDVGGVRDYTSESFCYYIPPKNTTDEVDLFSERIITLLNSREVIEAKGREASTFMEQNFSWNIIAKKTVALYKKIAS